MVSFPRGEIEPKLRELRLLLPASGPNSGRQLRRPEYSGMPAKLTIELVTNRPVYCFR